MGGLQARRTLSPAEQKVQNNALYMAIREVMAEILGREPTDAEMRGNEDMSDLKKRIQANSVKL